MTLRTVALLMFVTAILSAAVTRYYFPSTQIKTVDVEKQVTRTDVQTIIKTVHQPNGEESTTTTITDHTVKKDVDTKTLTINNKPNWLVSAGVQENYRLTSPVYLLQVNRRILGPLFLGGMANTRGDIGVTIGMEF